MITSNLAVLCGDALPIFASAADLARELPGLRREVSDLARSRGVEIVAAGRPSFLEPTEQPLTGGDPTGASKEMGWIARTQAIYGLHPRRRPPTEMLRSWPSIRSPGTCHSSWRSRPTRLSGAGSTPGLPRRGSRSSRCSPDPASRQPSGLGGLRGHQGPRRLGEHPLLLVLVGCASAPEVRHRGVARAGRTDGRPTR